MIKPLWTFFNLLRDRTPLRLSVEQYHYFFQVFQQMPMAHFAHYHYLRDFSKIFWLKDYEYEPEYNLIFEKAVDWEGLRTLLQIEEEDITQGDTDPDVKLEEGRNKVGSPEGKKEIQGEEPKPLSGEGDTQTEEKEETGLVDFELIISEQQGERLQYSQTAYTFESAFTLNDQSIMPFSLRHFAQRLRRKVETSVKVDTEELDFERMISQYSKFGYIDQIVYKLRDSSSSNVVLLADRYGSMLAYEYIEKQLKYAIKAIPDCTFEHYYFYNLPKHNDLGHYTFSNAGAGKPKHNSAHHNWNANTWFFILSDAGAHSGNIDRGRLSGSLKMWNYLKDVSPHVHWFNPVHETFLKGSTAQRLKMVLPMTYPTQDELIKFFQQ